MSRNELSRADVTVLDPANETTASGAPLLADLRVRVIRVEDAAGEALRGRGPFLNDRPGIERGLAHLLYNAGKGSRGLDLSRPAKWGEPLR